MGQFRRMLLSVYAWLFKALTKPWMVLYLMRVAYRVDFFQYETVLLVDILLCYKICFHDRHFLLESATVLDSPCLPHTVASLQQCSLCLQCRSSQGCLEGLV